MKITKELGPEELKRILSLKSTKPLINYLCIGYRVDVFKAKSGIIIGKVQFENGQSKLLKIENPIEFETSLDVAEYCFKAVS